MGRRSHQLAPFVRPGYVFFQKPCLTDLANRLDSSVLGTPSFALPKPLGSRNKAIANVMRIAQHLSSVTPEALFPLLHKPVQKSVFDANNCSAMCKIFHLDSNSGCNILTAPPL